MTFKKHGWIPYKRKVKFIEINVKDDQNRVIDFFKIYPKSFQLDKNERNDNPSKVLQILKKKYGFEFNVEKVMAKKWLEKDGEQ